ncbi:hypothetical protein ABLG96_08365 [Nakamurella sp. A5-74]|uniref:Uncharacterized protein n=1 Tax=Nakamurella sp. A5-74 TaxID=3158264 RepID=A0AAU8DV87_9ACTN
MTTDDRTVIDEVRARRDSGALSADLEARLRELQAPAPRRNRRRRSRWAAAIGIAASVVALAVASTVLFRGDRADVAAPTVVTSGHSSGPSSAAYSGEASSLTEPQTDSRLPGSSSNICGGHWTPVAIDTPIETSVTWPQTMYSDRNSMLGITLQNHSRTQLEGVLTSTVVLEDGSGEIVAILSGPKSTVDPVVEVVSGGSTRAEGVPPVGQCGSKQFEPNGIGTYTATLIVWVAGGLEAVSKLVQILVGP